MRFFPLILVLPAAMMLAQEPSVEVIRGSRTVRTSATQPPSQPSQVPQSGAIETGAVQRYFYDINDPPIQRPGLTTDRKWTAAEATLSLRTLRNFNGHEVLYLRQRDEVLSETPDATVVERRVDRYNEAGAPISRQLVREERRKLADGTIETTATTHESNLSGHFRPFSRVIVRETTEGNTTRRVRSEERIDINAGFRTAFAPYLQEESVEVRNSDSAATIDTVRKVRDSYGKLVVSEHEETVMRKSGNTSMTETKVWKPRVVQPQQVRLLRRTVATIVENPDGSSRETLQLYGLSSDGGANYLNSQRPVLQKEMSRETRVRPSGEIEQTSTIRRRSVADPTTMGERTVTRSVVRPTPDGQTVRTQVFEQSINGDLRPSESFVEEVQRQAP